MSSYIIRKFRPEDLHQVERINRVFLPENYPSSFFLENYRRFPDSFLVAESESGEIVGYIMCRVEYYPVGGRTLFLGHVLSIAVDKKYRRRGIGEALMKKAEEGLSNYGSHLVYLEVRVSNEPAIRLYKKLSYEVLGVIPHYYHDREEAYLMYKLLADVSKEEVEGSLGWRVRPIGKEARS